MSTLHITPGDTAAQSLREALARTRRDDRVVALHDDLAVGPLRDADEAPGVRAAFWHDVLDDERIDFGKEFEEEEARFEALAKAEEPIVIWHAQSASDQLMLRRVAYRLRNTPQRLNEVRLSVEDLPRDAQAITRADGATAVGMFAPDALEAKLGDVAPLSVLRTGRLALEWQAIKQADGGTRRDNTFKRGSFAELDAIIAAHARPEWRNATRVAAELMVADVGFTVSDTIAYWRCRKAAEAGLVELSDMPVGYASWRTLQMRVPDTNNKRARHGAR
jgi:hypothetical protein